MVQDEEWRIPLRRQLGPVERCEWDDLLRQLGPPTTSEGADSLEWMLTPSRKFSVKSLYLMLCQGLPHKHFCQIWGIGVPLKIRIFLWQLARKRLPSNDNIARRKGPSTGRCGLCGDPEDTNHIFFDCTLAKFMWSAVRELLHCSWNPSCFADFFRLLQGHTGQSRRVLWICSAALCWTLWNMRNKITIEGILPSQPADTLFKMSMYMQVWKPVARRQDRCVVELAISEIRRLYDTVRDRPS